MNRFVVPLCLALILSGALARVGAAERGRAVIRVDFGSAHGRIDRNIYGHFAEHLGACIYGGMWVGDDPKFANERGWRTDVRDLVRALQPPIIRWPGGCFSEFYHWEDGLGPREKRPLRFDWLWKKPEPNSVGTHEFMDFCRQVGAEPLVVVNVRTGTPEEAAAWVRYCNDPPATPAGRRRAANGHPKPFRVHYWGIGNESWDTGIETSAHKFVEFAQAMRQADPGIKLVAVGSHPGMEEGGAAWNRRMLEVAGGDLDYLAPHHYAGFAGRNPEDPGDYYANLATARDFASTLERAATVMDEVLADPEAGIAFDEWGIWIHSEQGIQHSYDLSDGLVAAMTFHAMQRLSGRVKMACWAQLVNVLGMIQADDRGAWVTPVYLAFQMYGTLCGDQAAASTVECETFDVPAAKRPGFTGIRYLDVSATRASDGSRGVLAVVNQHREAAIETELDLAGLPGEARVTAYEMNGPAPFAGNSREQPHAVKIATRVLDAPPATYTFPAHSVTVLVYEKQ